MAKKLFYLSLKALVVLIMWSCNKATDLTAVLDGPDPVNIGYTEIPFTTKTVLGDSSLTYNDSSFIPSHFMGKLNDFYFGNTNANLNFQVAIFSEPNLTNATLDSVVLSLEYDTTLMRYGAAPNSPVSFEVFELTSDIPTSKNYFSSSSVEYNPDPIGVVNAVIPNFRDTVFVREPQSLRIDTVSYVPHMRIRLDRIGQDLLKFTLQDFASVEIFQKKFKGLSLRPTPACEGVVFFEMLSRLTRLNLYYSVGDTARLMQIPVIEASCAVFNTYEHDLMGSQVELNLNNGQENDSIVYVQSMQGPDLMVTIGDLASLANSTINYAELEVNLAIPNREDTAFFAPIQQLIIRELKEDGGKENIIDLLLAGGNQLTDFFGGDLRVDEDTKNLSYRFNLTRHFQKVLNGDASNKIIISNLFKGAEPNRSILYGKSSHPLSAKIKVTHSQIN